MKLPKYYWWIGAVTVMLVAAILRWAEPYARADMIIYVVGAGVCLIIVIKAIRDFERQ